MKKRGRRRIRSPEYWRAYYTQKQREGALLIRAPEDGEKKNLPAPTVRRGLISISVITPCFQ